MVHVEAEDFRALGVATGDLAVIVLRAVLEGLHAGWTAMQPGHAAELTQAGGARELLESCHHEIVEVVRIAVYGAFAPWLLTSRATDSRAIAAFIAAGETQDVFLFFLFLLGA